MAYLHIDNLYKNQHILMQKECYAMEKLHGTSAYVSCKTDKNIGLFAGGSDYKAFCELFDIEDLKARFKAMALPPNKSARVYGEAYGGKLQGMRETYGDDLKFGAFEVKIGDLWLNVPNAEDVCNKLGLEFVHYNRIPCTLEAIDAERDADSVQAIRNGMGSHMREGIVLRPLEEMTLNNGERVIAKHKRDEFREVSTPRKVITPEKMEMIENAKAIANEWVTRERLMHILGRGELEAKLENTGKVISLMIEDVMREAKGEIKESPDANKQIGRLTALMFKDYLKESLK